MPTPEQFPTIEELKKVAEESNQMQRETYEQAVRIEVLKELEGNLPYLFSGVDDYKKGYNNCLKEVKALFRHKLEERKGGGV